MGTGGGSDLILRPFEAQRDARRLGDIWLEASLIAYPFVGLATLLDQKPFIETRYLPMADTWVAVLGDRTVGFISLLQGQMAASFVDPAYQGRGVGRALLNHARNTCGQAPLKFYSDHQGAVGFYRAVGCYVESQRA